MGETLHFLERHGYLVLFGAVLGRQAGLPIPANLLLVAGGALARSGRLSLPVILAISVATLVLADSGWYEAGRRWGERTLHFLCGLSADPDASVRKAKVVFARHGVRLLLFSKFVIGLDAVAVPLTGAARIAVPKFLAFDAVGAMLWSAAYTALGFVFSDQLDLVAAHLARAGALVALIAGIVVGLYASKKIANWWQFLRQFQLARITPEELHRKLNAGTDILVVDLQGRTNQAVDMLGIPGAVRINPHRLQQYNDVELSPSQEIVLYCASPGEFTSARIALALRERGIENVRPLAGGLRGWLERGFPVAAIPALTARSLRSQDSNKGLTLPIVSSEVATRDHGRTDE